MEEKITSVRAGELIRQTKGKLFGVTFIKKDGSIRHMAARVGVRKGVKGIKDFTEQDKKFGHIRAYDFNADNKGGFRIINLNTLSRLRVSGDTYIVEQ